MEGADPGRQSQEQDQRSRLEQEQGWDLGLTYPTEGLLQPRVSTSSTGNPCLQWGNREGSKEADLPLLTETISETIEGPSLRTMATWTAGRLEWAGSKGQCV